MTNNAASRPPIARVLVTLAVPCATGAALLLVLFIANGGARRGTDSSPVSFALNDLAGQTVSCPDPGGRVLLVNFWATWCGPCRAEMPTLVALQEKYRSKLEVIGVAIDSGSDQSLSVFARNIGLNYPVVAWTSELGRVLPPVSVLPTSFLLDRRGNIVRQYEGLLDMSILERDLLRITE